MTTFFRLLKDKDKAGALQAAVEHYRQGEPDEERIFVEDPDAFGKVPNTPFAYWVDDSIRELFVKLPPFESEGRTVKQGLATADDFRFVRAWWEVDAERRLDPGLGGAPDWREDLEGFQAWCRKRTHQGKYWVPFAKGGEYSPYYSDIHLVVNWKNEGEEIRNFTDPASGKLKSRPQNTDYYFRPGVTWPRRTNSRFGPYACPAASIFADKGPTAFVRREDLYVALGLMFSEFYREFIAMFVAGGDETQAGTPSRSYEVGIVRSMPYPKPGSSTGAMNHQVRAVVASLRERRSAENETSPGYAPPPGTEHDETLHGMFAEFLERRLFPVGRLLSFFQSINEQAFLTLAGNTTMSAPDSLKSLLQLPEEGDWQQAEIDLKLSKSISELTEELVARYGGNREYSVKSYHVERRVELLSHLIAVNPAAIANRMIKMPRLMSDEKNEFVAAFFSKLVAYAFGRWDLRMGNSSELIPCLVEPFDPLPVVAPTALVGPEGFPATSGNIVSQRWLRARPNAINLPRIASVDQPTIPNTEYPIPVPWDSILVNDQSSEADIVSRIRLVLQFIHSKNADEFENELCDELTLESMREYLGRPTNFFADHLKLYTKSRRKAPIYWPLSTKSGGYTVWVYYPRLTDQTLYTVYQLASEKHDALRRELVELKSISAGSRSKEQQRRFDQVSRDVGEVAEFCEEVLRITKLPYKPDHDDGVPICAAPLYKLFRHTQWSNYLAVGPSRPSSPSSARRYSSSASE